MEGSELVIVVAGRGRTPGMTRTDLMKVNAKVVRSVVKEVVRYAPNCNLMIVTNPVDVMTFLARKESNLPPNHIFGMGNILDTLRFRSYIAQELGVSREDTHGLVIGEHGESMVPLVEYASISGIPITNLVHKDRIARIVEKTRTSGVDVIKLKGATTYAPGAVIAMMADAVLKGRNRVMSVSTCPDGVYNCSAVSIGVPIVLGKNGVERIIELKLSSESQMLFDKSVNKVKQAITQLK